MKKLFHFLFLAFAGIHLAGGPYAIFQAYAWGNMIASYSKETGVVQAAKDTFSGEKPCHLCCKIAASKKADAESGKSDSAPNSPALAKAPEFFAASEHRMTPPSASDAPRPFFRTQELERGIGMNSPPSPPPRA